MLSAADCQALLRHVSTPRNKNGFNARPSCFGGNASSEIRMWIGFLPGKWESRRYVGQYIVTQNDVESLGRFDHMVAYAGWTMDDHFPEGFYYTKGYPTIYHPAPTPRGLPLRCMISENIDNLCFADRNISVTHAASAPQELWRPARFWGRRWAPLWHRRSAMAVHPWLRCIPLIQF